MRISIRTWWIFLLLTGFLVATQSPAAPPGRPVKPSDALDHMDRMYRSTASVSRMEMEIVHPSWRRTLKMDAWTRDLDRTFIRILEPKKDEGVATLRIKNEMWNFFPRINKVLKVPPSMMMGSWMGSDFTNDDLVKETTLKDDYESRFVAEPKPAKGTFVIELVPKETTATVWAKILVTLRESDWVPLEETYWDEKGVAMRRMTFSDVRTVSGRTLPFVMEMVPLSKGKEGQRTVIRYLSLSFDEKVPDPVFSLQNLKRKR